MAHSNRGYRDGMGPSSGHAHAYGFNPAAFAQGPFDPSLIDPSVLLHAQSTNGRSNSQGNGASSPAAAFNNIAPFVAMQAAAFPYGYPGFPSPGMMSPEAFYLAAQLEAAQQQQQQQHQQQHKQLRGSGGAISSSHSSALQQQQQQQQHKHNPELRSSSDPSLSSATLPQFNTVYVGNLSSNLTEELVRTFFSTCGTVTNLRIAGNTRFPSRYAFVEFTTPEAAQKAVFLTGTELDGRRLRITASKTPIGSKDDRDGGADRERDKSRTSMSLSRSSESVPTSGRRSSLPIMSNPNDNPEMVARTIYVSGVDPDLQESHLVQFFSVCGVVKQCRLCGEAGSSTHPTRFAFIEFGKPEEAVTALGLSGVNLGQYPLKVRPSKASIQNSTLTRRASVSSTTPPTSSRDSFSNSSSNQNSTNSISNPTNADPAAAEKISRTIYVGNIPVHFGDTEVQEAFAGCGTIHKLALAGGLESSADRPGTKRFAFIEFLTLEGARLALELDGMEIAGQSLRISRSKTPIHSTRTLSESINERVSLTRSCGSSEPLTEDAKRKRDSGWISSSTPAPEPIANTHKRARIDETKREPNGREGR